MSDASLRTTAHTPLTLNANSVVIHHKRTILPASAGDHNVPLSLRASARLALVTEIEAVVLIK